MSAGETAMTTTTTDVSNRHYFDDYYHEWPAVVDMIKRIGKRIEEFETKNGVDIRDKDYTVSPDAIAAIKDPLLFDLDDFKTNGPGVSWKTTPCDYTASLKSPVLSAKFASIQKAADHVAATAAASDAVSSGAAVASATTASVAGATSKAEKTDDKKKAVKPELVLVVDTEGLSRRIQDCPPIQIAMLIADMNTWEVVYEGSVIARIPKTAKFDHSTLMFWYVNNIAILEGYAKRPEDQLTPFQCAVWQSEILMKFDQVSRLARSGDGGLVYDYSQLRELQIAFDHPLVKIGYSEKPHWQPQAPDVERVPMPKSINDTLAIFQKAKLRAHQKTHPSYENDWYGGSTLKLDQLIDEEAEKRTKGHTHDALDDVRALWFKASRRLKLFRNGHPDTAPLAASSGDQKAPKTSDELEKASKVAGTSTAVASAASDHAGQKRQRANDSSAIRVEMAVGSDPVPFVRIQEQTEFNWIGLELCRPLPLLKTQIQRADSLFLAIGNYELKSVPGSKGEDPYHVTLAYGFDVKLFDSVRDAVTKALPQVTPGTLKIQTQPYFKELANKEGAIWVDVDCPQLEALKTQIETLTGVKYKPPLHVTLMTVTRVE